MARAIVPIEHHRIDAELLRLESLIASGLEPRARYTAQVIQVEGGAVLLFRVERSLNSPHRVTLKSHDKFYGRTASGKYSMDVQQLRDAFNENAQAWERLRAFRTERLMNILAGRSALEMQSGGKIVAHVLPISSFAADKSYDFPNLENHLKLFQPMNAQGWHQRRTFEGRLAFDRIEGASNTYIHLYRRGIIEAVEGRMLNYTQVNGQKTLPSLGYERLLVQHLPLYVRLLATFGVEPPIAIGISLTNVKGAILGVDTWRYQFEPQPILDDHLILPELIIESFDTPLIPQLRQIFDLVWNAGGIERSVNFDEAGNWNPTQGR